MKTLVVQTVAALLVAAGFAAVPGGTPAAIADTCPTTYVDSAPCTLPATPGATATVTVGASTGAGGAAARLATTCHVSAMKRGGVFSVTSPSGPVSGGTTLIKLHKVGTPGSAKLKISVASYSQPITRRLKPGVWHGTMVYLPASGSQFQYCGIVFRNLRVKKAAAHRHHRSVKLPTSVSAGLRDHAS